MKKLFAIATIVMIFGIVSCSDDDAATSGTSRYNIRMTDSPGNYSSIIVNVKEIEIKISGQSDVILQVNKPIDIVDLCNGRDTLLASADIPSGKITQVRLILADNGNTITADGQVYALETPSAQQSGLKLNVQQELVAGVEYTLKLDFDAGKSIVNTGSGRYILKPVIRVITEAISGSIRGTITPVGARPAVMAIIGGDTVTTTYADSVSGNFMLQGLAAGTYNVYFDAKNGYRDTTVLGQVVINGQITTMVSITF